MAKKIFPNDTPSSAVAPDDRVLFSDTSDSGNLKDASVSEFVEAGLSELTTDDLPEGASNKYFKDELVSLNPEVAENTAARHSHGNKALLDTYTVPGASIDDAVSKKHTHANQAVLDILTNLGDGTLFLKNNGTYGTVGGGEAGSSRQIALTGQTMDTVVTISNGDPVFFDVTVSKWKKAKGLQNIPTGVAESVSTGKVVLFGQCTVNGLFLSGLTYYYNPITGGLKTNIADGIAYKIGFAVSSNEMIVDIDSEGALWTPQGSVGSDAGYVLGGNSNGTRITRLRMDTETSADMVTTVPTSSAGKNNAGGNSATRGYSHTGLLGTATSTLCRYEFSTDTCSAISAALTVTRFHDTWINSPTDAFISSSAGSAVGNRLAYATETISATGAISTASGMSDSASFSNGTVGFIAGGNVNAVINSLTFSTVTVANTGATLSVGRWMGGSNNSAGTGYLSGGFTDAGGTIRTNALDIFDMGTYTRTSGTYSRSDTGMSGINNATRGYLMGGITAAIDKITFSGNVVSTIGAVLPSGINNDTSGSFQSGGYL